MSSKTILVTGGAGFIGSHVVDMLLGRGERVVVVDNFNDYYSPTFKRQNLKSALANDKFELVEADIRRVGLFEELFDKNKVDCVVHLAARAGVRPSLEDPKLYWDVNVMGSLNLLEAMRSAGVSQLVFASSSSVYGNREDGPFVETDDTDKQISPYGASKKSLELLTHTYAHLYGIKTTGLRFFTAYGPRNRPDMACFKFVDSVYNEKPLTKYGDGTSGRDYTFVTDVAVGILAAIDKPQNYEIVNLGNANPIKLNQMIATIEKVMDKKADIQIKEMQAGDVVFTYADTTKAKQLWNWEAKTDFEEGMSKLVEWYRENY